MPWKLAPCPRRRDRRPLPEPVERYTIIAQPSEDDRGRTLVALGYGDLVGLLAALADAGRMADAHDREGRTVGQTLRTDGVWRFWVDLAGQRRSGIDWERTLAERMD
jgi:hypothetical protein